MALSQATFAKDTFNTMVGVGDVVISSDAEFVIEGRENASVLFKSFPMPVLSPGEGIEIPMQMGLKMWQKSQMVVQQQGSFTMRETVAGHSFKLLADLINNGGTFRAKLYEGTRQHHLRYFQLERCHFQLDPGERDWESNTQVLELQGNLFYHYFGEVKEGNLQGVKPAFADMG